MFNQWQLLWQLLLLKAKWVSFPPASSHSVLGPRQVLCNLPSLSSVFSLLFLSLPFPSLPLSFLLLSSSPFFSLLLHSIPNGTAGSFGLLVASLPIPLCRVTCLCSAELASSPQLKGASPALNSLPQVTHMLLILPDTFCLALWCPSTCDRLHPYWTRCPECETRPFWLVPI